MPFEIKIKKSKPIAILYQPKAAKPYFWTSTRNILTAIHANTKAPIKPAINKEIS
jgi:hypothetical protein